MSRCFVRAALPVILGVFAFIVVEYLSQSQRGDRTALISMLNQPIDVLTVRNVPLQVAVHDLIEFASTGTAIRVDRLRIGRCVWTWRIRSRCMPSSNALPRR